MLGTVQFGLPYGIANTSGQPSYDTVIAIMREAFDAGITSFDTSASYGTSEEVLGRALEQLGVSKKAEIVTKIPPVPEHLSETQIIAHIDIWLGQSLRRLKVEQLAAALFHCEDDAVYLPLLQKWVEKGDIRQAGVSLDSTAYPPEAVSAAAVQVPCNVFDHRFDSFIASASAAGVNIFARSVYLQGLLLMPEEAIPPHLVELIAWRYRLGQLAEKAQIPLAELAVRYLYSNQGITSILTGVDNVNQLRENIQYSHRGPLPADLYREVRDAVPLLQERLIRPKLWKKN